MTDEILRTNPVFDRPTPTHNGRLQKNWADRSRRGLAEVTAVGMNTWLRWGLGFEDLGFLQVWRFLSAVSSLLWSVYTLLFVDPPSKWAIASCKTVFLYKPLVFHFHRLFQGG